MITLLLALALYYPEPAPWATNMTAVQLYGTVQPDILTAEEGDFVDAQVIVQAAGQSYTQVYADIIYDASRLNFVKWLPGDATNGTLWNTQVEQIFGSWSHVKVTWKVNGAATTARAWLATARFQVTPLPAGETSAWALLGWAASQVNGGDKRQRTIGSQQVYRTALKIVKKSVTDPVLKSAVKPVSPKNK